uniref:DUF4585 domain-containing protein n=1 Tax=Oryzias sinensis TaxID=183150 RepID=A0A8C8DTA4_9TELE
MEIMVTVREGKPPQTVDESINADERQMKFSKNEGNESVLDRRHFSPGCEGNTCSKEMNSVKAVKGQKSHSTMSESLAKAVESTSPEAPKETLSLEAKDINVARVAIEKTINPQQGNPALLPKPVTQTDVMKGTQLIKTDAEKSKEQTALGNSDFISNVVTTGPEDHSDSEMSSKKLTETFGLKCTNMDVQTASSSEESKQHSAKLFSNATLTSSSTKHENKHLPPDLQNKETDIRDSSHGDDNLHIDSIAVRVVPAVTDNNKRNIVEKPLIADFPSSASFAAEKQQNAASSSKANDEQCSEDVSSASSEHRMKETLENNLAVQHVLSSVRKLSDLLKMNSKVNNLNVVNETAEAKAESNVELKELDYFQVQGQVETNNEAQNNCTTEKATAKKSELQDTPPNKTASIEDLPKDGESEVFVFSVDHCLKKEDLMLENPQDDSIKRNKLKAVDAPASKLNTSSFEPCNNEGKVNVSQANHIGKNPSENPCSLSATDKENSRTFPQTKAEKVTIKPDVKPKSKDKTSTIPEISAIADYARLKVIVSEDRELNTAQDFPPSKKEGFFPLIRSHHSRRPVFTTDPQGSSVKEKSLSTKPDVSVKVSKEPKATIFPITEREHQRTGMFKMGDKDKREKMLLETDRTLLAQTKQVSEVEIREIHQKTGQPNSSPAVSGLTSKELTYLDKNLPSQAALGERHHTKENTTYLRKDESPENQQNININVKGERADRLKKERLANQEDDNKMKKLEKGKQLEEELMARVDNRKNNVRIEHIMEESRASLAEEERRATQREEEKRAKEREAVAQMIKERREQQRQADKKTEEERKTTSAEDTITDPNTKDFQRKTKEQIRIPEHEKCRFGQEQLRRTATEQQWRNTQENQHGRAAREQIVDQQIKRESDTQEKQIIQGEQQQVEHQSKPLQKEHQQRAAEEQQSRSITREKEKRATTEQKTRFTQEEKQIVTLEQQQRRAAEEQQRKLFQEEQQRKAAEEQQRKRFQDEKQRQAETEQQIRRLQEKQQRQVAEEHQKITTEGRQGKCFQKEQERGAAKEQEKTIALEDKQHRTIEKKQIPRQDEHQNVLAKEEDLSRVAEQIHESTLSKKVYKKEHMPEQEKEEQQLRRRRSLNHTLMKTKEEGVMAVDEKEITLKPEEKLVQDQSAKSLEEKIIAGDLIQEKSKKKEENLAINRGKTGVTQAEIQKQTQKMDGLQYYAFTSTDMEVRSREKRLSSLLRSEQRSSPGRLDSPDDSIIQTKSSRPLAPASPAPSLPRSNTSSPALGTKPSMFKVKDNTLRSSSFIKSVKPRFHKNFGDDFLLASPLDRSLEKVDDERERIKSGAGTPVHTEIGTKQFSANTEFSTLLSSSAQDYSFSHHRPYSRRSIALDDDESRSVISNLSEDVESYATSAADVGDVRGLLDFERPESACSFSSDVSRSLGKPPVVPPKTEKALRRAQRLTSRRMKKELSKVSAGGDKETSSVPSSSSTETHQSNNDAVASPHFSQPVSLAHAPVLGSILPSSSSELQPVLKSFHSSPHATGPVSVPILPNATSSVSLPTVSPHTPGTDSQPAAPKTVPNAPSSSTLHHANHPTPVAQYHVESSCFSQSYPMTQRKVLQDLGSGQYFVVDVPVQVQTKTFFDPETGKYVQLNVRESGQSISRPRTQQTQLHQTKLQPPPFTQTPAAGKPFMLYQRYHSYPQNYQPTAITPVRRSRSSAPGSLQQNHESLSESKIYGNLANEVEQNSVEPCYSPERTPYMDTVIDTDKTHNSVKSTQNPMESASECGTKYQTENHETSFQYQGRDIITMSELEDFMEATEW